MTLDDLTVNFDHLDSEGLLSDWTWLIGKRKVPVLLTASGDAFLQDQDDGSIHFLDVASGELIEVAASGDEFQRLLTDTEFVSSYFSLDLIAELRNSRKPLGPGRIFSFKIAPALGGDFEADNVEAADIEVHFSIAGQLHEKISALPEGTDIGDIDIR
jgi:hypothetical protein